MATSPQNYADPTLDTLGRMFSEENCVVLRNVPIFTPHERTSQGPNGETTQINITEEDLPDIANQINERMEKYGVPAIMTIGHRQQANPAYPEKLQPDIVGGAKNAKVGTFGPQQTPGVLADLYYAKEDWEEAKKFPWRSVDFYPGSKKVTGVALLKRDPFLPMGIVMYQGESNFPVRLLRAPIYGIKIGNYSFGPGQHIPPSFAAMYEAEHGPVQYAGEMAIKLPKIKAPIGALKPTGMKPVKLSNNEAKEKKEAGLGRKAIRTGIKWTGDVLNGAGNVTKSLSQQFANTKGPKKYESGPSRFLGDTIGGSLAGGAGGMLVAGPAGVPVGLGLGALAGLGKFFLDSPIVSSALKGAAIGAILKMQDHESPIKYEADCCRAPKEGIVIAGRYFGGGQHIPPGFADQMSPEQCAMCGSKPEMYGKFNSILGKDGPEEYISPGLAAKATMERAGRTGKALAKDPVSILGGGLAGLNKGMQQKSAPLYLDGFDISQGVNAGNSALQGMMRQQKLDALTARRKAMSMKPTLPIGKVAQLANGTGPAKYDTGGSFGDVLSPKPGIGQQAVGGMKGLGQQAGAGIKKTLQSGPLKSALLGSGVGALGGLAQHTLFGDEDSDALEQMTKGALIGGGLGAIGGHFGKVPTVPPVPEIPDQHPLLQGPAAKPKVQPQDAKWQGVISKTPEELHKQMSSMTPEHWKALRGQITPEQWTELRNKMRPFYAARKAAQPQAARREAANPLQESDIPISYSVVGYAGGFKAAGWNTLKNAGIGAGIGGISNALLAKMSGADPIEAAKQGAVGGAISGGIGGAIGHFTQPAPAPQAPGVPQHSFFEQVTGQAAPKPKVKTTGSFDALLKGKGPIKHNSGHKPVPYGVLSSIGKGLGKIAASEAGQQAVGQVAGNLGTELAMKAMKPKEGPDQLQYGLRDTLKHAAALGALTAGTAGGMYGIHKSQEAIKPGARALIAPVMKAQEMREQSLSPILPLPNRRESTNVEDRRPLAKKYAGTGEVLGGTLGAVGGAVGGGALGSFIPGPGTVIGGAAGGVAGEELGRSIGKNFDTPSKPKAVKLQNYAAQHAPVGGGTFAGKHFVGGQFIPGEVLDKATPEEKAQLKEKKGIGGLLKSKAKGLVKGAVFGKHGLDPTHEAHMEPELKNNISEFVQNAPPEVRKELEEHLNTTLTGHIGNYISHATPEELHELHKDMISKLPPPPPPKGGDKAPVKGAKIGGKFYKPGQYITPEVMAQASPEQVRAIRGPSFGDVALGATKIATGRALPNYSPLKWALWPVRKTVDKVVGKGTPTTSGGKTKKALATAALLGTIAAAMYYRKDIKGALLKGHTPGGTAPPQGGNTPAPSPAPNTPPMAAKPQAKNAPPASPPAKQPLVTPPPTSAPAPSGLTGTFMPVSNRKMPPMPAGTARTVPQIRSGEIPGTPLFKPGQGGPKVGTLGSFQDDTIPTLYQSNWKVELKSGNSGTCEVGENSSAPNSPSSCLVGTVVRCAG